MIHSRLVRYLFLLVLATTSVAVLAQDPDSGARHVKGFDLPASAYLSAQARKKVIADANSVDPLASMDNAALVRNLQHLREGTDAWAKGEVAKLRARHAVEISHEQWGGVPVVLVEPKGAKVARGEQLLIEVHGGGFVLGRAESMGLLDAIPVAAASGMTVAAVEYRQGPEFHFPAATDDVLRVYRAALERLPPSRIGLFGCSSGGVLTTEVLARIALESLPMPGAAGVFCAGGDARYGGDTRFISAAINGLAPPPSQARTEIMEDLYYGDVDFRDPLVSPAFSDDVLRHFPPTLFVTATRAPELSSAVYMHGRLTRLGRRPQLNVWDGLGHAFYLDADLPESREAFEVIAGFFRDHLVPATPDTAQQHPAAAS